MTSTNQWPRVLQPGHWFSISRMCQNYYSVVCPWTIPGRLHPPWGVSENSAWMEMFLANLFPAAVSQGSASLGCRSICCTQWHVGITTQGFMSSLCSCSKNMLKYVKQWKLACDVWFHLLAAIPPGPLQSDLPNPILLRIDLGCGSASKVHSSFSVWHRGCQPASQQPALSLHVIHPVLTVIRIIWFNLARWVIKCSDCLCVFGTFLEQCDGVSCKGKKREKKNRILVCSSKCKLPKSSS